MQSEAGPLQGVCEPPHSDQFLYKYFTSKSRDFVLPHILVAVPVYVSALISFVSRTVSRPKKAKIHDHSPCAVRRMQPDAKAVREKLPRVLTVCITAVYVGRTHTIVRLQTRIRRKDGAEKFGGFVYTLDGFLQRDFVLWVFMCPINIQCLYFRLPRPTVSLFPAYHAKGYHAPSIPHGLSRPYHHCTAITPVYIYPAYHAIV